MEIKNANKMLKVHTMSKTLYLLDFLFAKRYMHQI